MRGSQRSGRVKGSVVVAAAVGLAGGLVAGLLIRLPGPSGEEPLRPAFAVAAESDEAFAVCTAPIDRGMEGFFMLDFETGDLSGGVLNQATSKFTGAYRTNVLEALGFEPGQAKAPRFLLVSGLADLPRGRGTQFANSVLYVTDTSTGKTAAFALPWNSQQAGKGFSAEPVLLDVANPRGVGL